MSLRLFLCVKSGGSRNYCDTYISSYKVCPQTPFLFCFVRGVIGKTVLVLLNVSLVVIPFEVPGCSQSPTRREA